MNESSNPPMANNPPVEVIPPSYDSILESSLPKASAPPLEFMDGDLLYSQNVGTFTDDNFFFMILGFLFLAIYLQFEEFSVAQRNLIP